jgi:hypothetical protein
MSLLPDDSLNYGDYCHNFHLMVGVTSSLTTLSVILGLVVASTDRVGGPFSIKNHPLVSMLARSCAVRFVS